MDVPPIEPVVCRCCGMSCMPTQTLGGLIPSCLRCSGHWAAAVRCGGIHGAQLEGEALQLYRSGLWSAWYVVAVMATDDAQLAGRLGMEIKAGSAPPVRLRVDVAPRLWEVVLGRSMARNIVPDPEEVIGACIRPFAGHPNNEHTRETIAGELRRALTATIGEVVELDIQVMPDPEHGGGFVANVTARVAPEGAVVLSEAGPPPVTDEDRAVDQLAKVLPFRGRAEA